MIGPADEKVGATGSSDAPGGIGVEGIIIGAEGISGARGGASIPELDEDIPAPLGPYGEAVRFIVVVIAVLLCEGKCAQCYRNFGNGALEEIGRAHV